MASPHPPQNMVPFLGSNVPQQTTEETQETEIHTLRWCHPLTMKLVPFSFVRMFLPFACCGQCISKGSVEKTSVLFTCVFIHLRTELLFFPQSLSLFWFVQSIYNLNKLIDNQQPVKSCSASATWFTLVILWKLGPNLGVASDLGTGSPKEAVQDLGMYWISLLKEPWFVGKQSQMWREFGGGDLLVKSHTWRSARQVNDFPVRTFSPQEKKISQTLISNA